MKPSEVLRKAAKKLSKPENWTRWQNARDIKGNFVFSDSEDAVSWCMNGAIHSFKETEKIKRISIRFVNICVKDGLSLSDFNDRIAKSNTDVVNKLNEAAALAESQGM